MNRIFKVIWNKTTQRTEVVSELARGMAKSSSSSVVNTTKLVKPVLKLSLLSICLCYPTWVMAETNTDDGRFTLINRGLLLDKNNGKYILGVYDPSTGSFGFGKAQVGTKDEVSQNGNIIKPAAVGNFQLAIGHDTLIASGYKGIAIGSNYDSSASDGRREYYFSPLDARQGGTQGAYAISLGSGAQAIGRHTLALGANSGNGGAYNGYDDAVFLGSLSRIKSVGQGRENDNINVNDLETKYTEAVKAYNASQTQDALNKVVEAGRNINNAALNKVEGMTIKSNVAHPSTAGKFTTQTEQVSQVNGSSGTKTVSILSVGGKDGNNTMYRQIQNVAAGRIAYDSNDAVTGSQLYYVRNYTGWNIGHYDDATKANTTTGRVNNDHTVIFKPGDYTDVYTTLDSTNQSTVGIEVKTASLSTEIANGKISKVLITEPVGTDASKTVAKTAGVKSVLEDFNKIKADKVDIMGYSHVNETDADKVTENRIITAKNWDSQFDNNSGTYHESAGAKGNRAITSGVRANALANDSIAIGSLANVNNNWGSQLVAAERSIAIGREATVNAGQDSIAMGSGAQILHSDSTKLNANSSIAIGKLSKIDQASNAIALGNNASIGGNYAANGSWYASDNSIAIGNETTVSRENSVGIGTNVSVARENSVVIGQNASATRERVVAIGAYSKAEGDRTVAIGPEATASASRSIVIGGLGDNSTDNQAKSEEGATQAIVIGNGAQAKAAASYSITLGNSAKTEAGTGISIGDRANVASGATSGIALGKSAVANKSGDIAIGGSSSTSDKHTVSGLQIGDATLSTGVAATDNGTVSFGNDNIKRQIQNVGAGEISDKSSDVITGSQLYYVIKAADEIAKTEYTFKVNGVDKKIMRNNGTSKTNNANNTLDFRAGDGLEVAYENNAVTYKLNAASNQAITDAKNAATTVTNSLQEINRSVARAETAASAASTSASAARSSATAASTSASAARSSATAASTSASAASSSATAASTSASAARSSATAASTSASAANSSATAASTSASAANSSATAASTSASAANSSATAASTSASAANSSATAASTSASAANSSATAASTSASAANSSATAASTSASAANSSATAASTSASAANSSATAASTSASAADSSATAASTSASAANSSATAASSSASAANSSATAASSSASAANSSATAASSSASAANSSATAASSSASAANSSATAASTSASAANSSATAASSAASAAQSSAQRIEDSGLISKDGKTAFAADNTSNRDSAKAKGKDATAAGYGSNASGKNATAIGNNATASGRNSTALGQNATATAENSVAIGQDSVANERNTVSVGRVGNERRITNVADPVNNTDAANKRYVDNAVGSVRNDLRKTEKKLRGGVAGATAMANIPQVTQPGKLMVGAGIGNYKGQSAVAVGLSKSSDNNRVIFKMSGSATTQGDYNIGAGIGYQW